MPFLTTITTDMPLKLEQIQTGILQEIQAFINNPDNRMLIVCAGGCIILVVATIIMAAIQTYIKNHEVDDDYHHDYRDNNYDNHDDTSVTPIHQRKTFWVCDECGQEFRLRDGTVPVKCPNCDAFGYDEDEAADDEEYAESFTCPACGEVTEMLDGDEPINCPYCGLDIEEYKDRHNYDED